MSFVRKLTVFVGSLMIVSAFAASPGTNNTAATTATATKPAATSTAKATTPVNINTATVEQLKTLKGIGASKAEAILEYRTAHGSFKTPDDLANVKGFSSKTVASLQKNNPNRIVTQ